MNDTLQTIDIARIDITDYRYIATYPRKAPDTLVHSIRIQGLINPPLLEPVMDSGGQRYRIICGYRRVAACVVLDMPVIPARIIENSEPEPARAQTFLLLAFFDNIGHRIYNLVEVSLWLELLTQSTGTKTVIENFMGLLGVNNSPEILRRYLLLAQASPTVKSLACRSLLSLKEIPIIAALSEADQESYMQLSNEMNLGINLRREFLNLLSEISRRDRSSISSILERKEIRDIRVSQQEIPAKVEEIRAALRRWRYPTLQSVEESFDALLKETNLPPEMQMTHPPYFEEEQYRLSLVFKDEEEFERLVESLNSKKDSLFDMIKGIRNILTGEECNDGS